MEIDNPCNDTSYAFGLTSFEEERRARHMEKFKDAMLQISMSKNPHRSPDQLAMLEKYIDERLPAAMPSLLCAPDHPPYAEMIKTAIRTLAEKRGSSKASISNFINETCQNLPLQHDVILTRDLEKLVQVGQIICIYKSRYKIPADNKPNTIKQQQDGEKQIVLGEVGGFRTKYDGNDSRMVALPEKLSAVVEVNDPVDVDLDGLPLVLPEKHPTSIVEVFDPIDIDSAGGMLVELTEQPMAMIELETLGGDGGGSKPLEAVTGAVKASQEKFPRGRNLRKRKSEVDQQEKTVEKSTEVVPSLGALLNDDNDVVGHGTKESLKESVLAVTEVFDPVEVDDVGDRLITLPKSYTTAMIELEIMGADDGGSKPLEAVIEAVKPSQEKLPQRGRNLRKRKSEIEQQEETVERSTETVPSMGTLLNDDNDVVGHGTKESLKESLLAVTKVFDPVEVDDAGDRLVTLSKKHTTAMIELVTMGGDDGGPKPLEAVNGAVKPSQEKLPQRGRNLRKRKCEVEQQEETVEKSTETVPSLGTLLMDDNYVGHGTKESLKESLLAVTEVFDPVEVDDAGDSLITLPKKHATAMIELETMGGDDGGSKPLETLIGAVKPSQEKLPQRGRNLRKRKSEVEQQEDKIETITETIPSLKICKGETKMKLPISDPRSLPNKHQQQQRKPKKRLGRPPMRKCEGKRVPRRGPGRPAKIKKEVEQQQETIPSTAAAGNDDPVVGIESEISDSQEQQQRHQCSLHMKKRKSKQKQEVLMQDEQGSLVLPMKEPAITDVAVRDTTQEQQQQPQREVPKRQLRPRFSESN